MIHVKQFSRAQIGEILRGHFASRGEIATAIDFQVRVVGEPEVISMRVAIDDDEQTALSALIRNAHEEALRQ